MKKYYVSLLLRSEQYGEKDQMQTRFLDFKEIKTEKDVKDMEARCQYISNSKKWKLIGFSLVGEPSPKEEPPMDFKKSAISKKEILFLKKLQDSVSELRNFTQGGQYYEWIGKLSETDIAKIRQIVTDRTDVYIVPMSTDFGFGVGYFIKLIPGHYPFLQKEIKTLFEFSEKVFDRDREESKLFFPICQTKENLALLKIAEPTNSVREYAHYEY